MANFPLHQHIFRQFDQELADIRGNALRLGGLAEEQIALAMKALLGNDGNLAEQVIGDDSKINELEVSVNSQCLQILARRQPTASDLRLVVAVIKVINDLERIGDEAKNIARTVRGMSVNPPEKRQIAPLAEFAKGVGKLLHDTLDAFARIDVEAAMQVKQRDHLLDLQYGDILHEQITAMSNEPHTIPVALHIMWAARALERIGDRSCNICEYAIYYAKGKDIRHMSLEQAALDLMEQELASCVPQVTDG